MPGRVGINKFIAHPISPANQSGENHGCAKNSKSSVERRCDDAFFRKKNATFVFYSLIVHIAILGSRGIPNRYGGFEQFAAELAPGLLSRGFQVTVYCTHHHPYDGEDYRGVKLIRCFDPEPYIGGTGQFIYDLNCILDSRRRNFDLIYQLGYTTSGIWQWLMPKHLILVSNMDGLEWSRAKYPAPVKALLRWSERAVVHRSNFLIADALPIKEYLDATYHTNATYLAYSASRFENPDPQVLSHLHLQPRRYMLLIARLQPDNHVEMAIEGVLASGTLLPLVVVGDTRNRHGHYLQKKFESDQIRFVGGIFNPNLLDNLRHFAAAYFHGHSAGGTNPSLLEAMAAGARILAHDNPFNRSVLEAGAAYFSSARDIARLLRDETIESQWTRRMTYNLHSIDNRYAPAPLLNAYAGFFEKCLNPPR